MSRSPDRWATTVSLRRSKSNGTSSSLVQPGWSSWATARSAASSGLRIPVSQTTVHPRERPARDRSAARRVRSTLDAHLACGERAGLVAAEDIDAAEVLDGRQVLDDDVLRRHASRALSQRHRRDHRQKLRREPDGQGHGEEEGLERGAVHRQACREQNEHQNEDRARDEQPELAKPTFELGLRRTRGQARDHVAELGARAGGGHARDRGPADDGGTQPGDPAAIAIRCARVFLGGQRLARQRRLLQVQVARLEQPGVGGHEIAGRQADDVARDDDGTRQLLPHAISHDGRRGRHGAAQLLRCPLRVPGLHEVDRDAESDHPGDEGRVDGLPEQRRQAARDEKHQGQRVAEHRQELQKRRPAPGARFVGPELVAKLLRFGGGESGPGA